jgi:hypothetical protein
VVFRASALSGAHELALVDETVEKGKRLGAVQAGRRSNVAVGDRAIWARPMTTSASSAGLSRRPGGRVERSTEVVGRTAAVAALLEEALVSKALQDVARRVGVDAYQLPDVLVRANLAAGGVDERDSVDAAQITPSLEFVDPCAFA